jgi:hypothetical protein
MFIKKPPMLTRLLLLACASMFSGCVGSWAFEDSAELVNFNGPEGKTGWSKYEQNAFFPGVSRQVAYEAAKEALAANGFALRRADLASGVVLGEHGMTLVDWNVMAAIYLRDEAGGVRIRVQAEGSKDIGFTGDDTGRAWAPEIINSMHSRLRR